MHLVQKHAASLMCPRTVRESAIAPQYYELAFPFQSQYLFHNLCQWGRRVGSHAAPGWNVVQQPLNKSKQCRTSDVGLSAHAYHGPGRFAIWPGQTSTAINELAL